jgi:hypothetical protein
MVCDTKRPSEDLVNKAWTQNDHGGGVAWREGGFVKWEKGLKLPEMVDRCENLPLPYIAHFRIASQGGRSLHLCHPFEISREAKFDSSGKTKGSVLFHNGTWVGWKDFSLASVLKAGIKIPVGPWSDTRALAFMTSIYGPGVLEFINEKTVVFGPKDIEIFGDGWEEVEDIAVSNKIFLTRFHGQGKEHSKLPGYVGNVNQTQVQVITAAERGLGGSSLDITFRGSLKFTPGRKNLPETIQENSEEVHAETGGSGETTQRALTLVSKVPLTEDQEDLIDAWPLRMNPKKYKSSQFLLPASTELSKRIDAASKGITVLGRM